MGLSKQFQEVVKDNNYTLKLTGTDSSAQNGLAEKPNQDLAQTMRALLYSSGLGSQYWSYALRHVVYLKNHLPHSANNWKSLYQLMNNKKPNLSKLKVFGARVQIKKSGQRRMKLDSISDKGTFMTYTGTDKIIYCVDEAGNE